MAAPGAACTCAAARRLITAFCTFSKARTSIWRTRSREPPNSSASSSSLGEPARLDGPRFESGHERLLKPNDQQSVISDQKARSDHWSLIVDDCYADSYVETR